MPTLTRKAKTVKFSTEFVSITIRINDVRYAVDPIAPGEDGTRAFRLCKASGDHEVYDVIRTHSGICECSCPDYEARHRGNGLGTCKHGTALVMVGLLDAPSVVTIVTNAPEALGERCGPGCPASVNHPAPCEGCPKAPAPDFDEPYVIANIVARGDACWINQGPKGGPTPPCWSKPEVLANRPEPSPEPEPTRDTDGISYEDDGFGLDDDEDADEDGLGGDWDDEARWEIGPGPGMTLAELADHEAAVFRGRGTYAGDLFASHMATLASLIRSLDAMTPGAFLDRLDAMHDAAAI